MKVRGSGEGPPEVQSNRISQTSSGYIVFLQGKSWGDERLGAGKELRSEDDPRAPH